MNIPTLMTRLAALQGHPLPVSSRPAPSTAAGSEVLEGSTEQQIPRARRLRKARSVEFVRRAGAGRGERDLGLRMDVLMPATPGHRPLVVYVPGGGFVVAPKVGGARARGYVAAAGYVVASVEYRTTRHGATYVDAVADIRAAIQHLRANADRYGIDPSRVAVWGESAGGYLASMVGVTGGDRRLDPDGVAVGAVINKFGGSALERLAEGFDDVTIASTYSPGNSPARFVHGPAAQEIDEDVPALRAADPATYASAASPPFLLFHGDDDRLVSPVQTAALHSALRKAGADSTRYLILGAGHGDIAVKGGEEKLWTTVPMMQLIVRFLDRTIGPAVSGG